MNAVVGQQHLVHRKGDRFVFARDHLDGPGVGADQNDLLVDQPLGGGIADPGLAAVVERVLRRILGEEVAPAGVEKDRVALAQGHVVGLEPRLHILRCDHGSFVEARVLASRIGPQLAGVLVDFDEVDQDASGGE